MSKLKLCFVSFANYPVLAKKQNMDIIGGAEIQQALIARNLKDRFEISFITYDHGQKNGEIVDDITIKKTFPLKSKRNILEKVLRLFLLWKALKRANSDIYYFRGGGVENGFIAIFCKLFKKKFVHAVALDHDLTLDYLRNNTKLDNLLYRYGLKSAVKVIVQSEHQKDLLKKNFNRDGVVIKNAIFLPKPYDKEKVNKRIILWVATIKQSKNPSLFLDLTERFPDKNFVMIGGSDPNERELYDDVKSRAKSIPNLDFLGYQPYEVVNKYFKEAYIFVNTSEKEGFPNTFLQAWSNYVPVISLYIDPDECICKNKIGLHSKTFDRMVEDLQCLSENMSLWRRMSYKARKYVEEEHNIETIAERYTKLFYGLIKGERNETKNSG